MYASWSKFGVIHWPISFLEVYNSLTNPGSSGDSPELWLPQCQKQRCESSHWIPRDSGSSRKWLNWQIYSDSTLLFPKCAVEFRGSPSCKLGGGHFPFCSLLPKRVSFLPFTACTSKVHGPVDASWSLRRPDPAVQQVLVGDIPICKWCKSVPGARRKPLVPPRLWAIPILAAEINGCLILANEIPCCAGTLRISSCCFTPNLTITRLFGVFWTHSCHS